MNHVVIENSRTLFWQKVQRGKIGEGSRFKGQWHRVRNVFVVLGTCQCWISMLLHLKKNPLSCTILKKNVWSMKKRSRSWIWQLHECCNYSLCRYNVKLCGRRTWISVFFDLLTNFFDKWFWAGVIIICWFVVAHEQICNCQRLFVVYGEFLGKPNVQGQLRMLLSLFFV